MLVEPVAAGVLFTRNPITGADERMIEASWGLGEAVVSGIVVPDRATLSPQGLVLDFVVGDKDVKIWYDDGDGTVETPVDEALRSVPCVDETAPRGAERSRQPVSARLGAGAATSSGRSAATATIYLLQCRPITTLGGPDRVRPT